MRRIGIRELRQEASACLREVERGETLEVTDRGRPVAWIVPVPREQGLDDLEASGRLVAAVGDPLELGEPLEPKPGASLPSEVLARLREDER
jgi:prevent-host-death family protein